MPIVRSRPKITFFSALLAIAARAIARPAASPALTLVGPAGPCNQQRGRMHLQPPRGNGQFVARVTQPGPCGQRRFIQGERLAHAIGPRHPYEQEKTRRALGIDQRRPALTFKTAK